LLDVTVQDRHRPVRKIVYVDMDNVLVDFQSAFPRVSEAVLQQYEGRLDEVPGLFALMDPMPGAIDSYAWLTDRFDTYVLSTSPWENPSAWSDKLLWIKGNLGAHAYKRLIMSHHKNLNAGDYLIDDRTNNGADRFGGEHIVFGSDRFPDWPTVTKYLGDRV
jgi:5'(3')-deoxyribonucleotidase